MAVGPEKVGGARSTPCPLTRLPSIHPSIHAAHPNTQEENDPSAPSTRRELGLLFMSESGARSLADQVRKKAPRKVAKEIVVGRTTLDRVYTLAASADARPPGLNRP